MEKEELPDFPIFHYNFKQQIEPQVPFLNRHLSLTISPVLPFQEPPQSSLSDPPPQTVDVFEYAFNLQELPEIKAYINSQFNNILKTESFPVSVLLVHHKKPQTIKKLLKFFPQLKDLKPFQEKALEVLATSTENIGGFLNLHDLQIKKETLGLQETLNHIKEPPTENLKKRLFLTITRFSLTTGVMSFGFAVTITDIPLAHAALAGAGAGVLSGLIQWYHNFYTNILNRLPSSQLLGSWFTTEVLFYFIPISILASLGHPSSFITVLSSAMIAATKGLSSQFPVDRVIALLTERKMRSALTEGEKRRIAERSQWYYWLNSALISGAGGAAVAASYVSSSNTLAGIFGNFILGAMGVGGLFTYRYLTHSPSYEHFRHFFSSQKNKEKGFRKIKRKLTQWENQLFLKVERLIASPRRSRKPQSTSTQLKTRRSFCKSLLK
ncbi:MAG: hypothetical protein D6797_00360 [Bdellovibrio sp.]|nr:MAG: hypothetical protein D6797_00360 [Bdellovibrio sp.]